MDEALGSAVASARPTLLTCDLKWLGFRMATQDNFWARSPGQTRVAVNFVAEF